MKVTREEDEKKMKDQGEEFHKNIIFPKYVFDERLKLLKESLPKPPSTIYKEIGHDKQAPENPEVANKHYRRFYDDELENVKEIFKKKPFHTSDVIRG